MTKGGWRSHGEWLLDRRRFSSPWVGPKAHDSSGRDDNFVAKWELVSDRSWGTLGALLARASRKTRNSSWLERAPPRLLETIASWRSRCTKHLQRNTARQCLCGKLSLHLRVEFNTNRHGNLAHTYYRMPASESRSQGRKRDAQIVLGHRPIYPCLSLGIRPLFASPWASQHGSVSHAVAINGEKELLVTVTRNGGLLQNHTAVAISAELRR
jgi:hypothetical protein